MNFFLLFTNNNNNNNSKTFPDICFTEVLCKPR